MRPQMRRKARFLAVQAIYQWQLTADSVSSIKAQFTEKINPKKTDEEYFNYLVDGVIKNVGRINETVIPFLDRKIDDLDEVELAVIRLAIYELMESLDVPYKVIINEALELTKEFGSVDGYKYVNGVLDKAAKEIRRGQTCPRETCPCASEERGSA